MRNDFDPTRIEDKVIEAVKGLGVSANVFDDRPRSSTLDLTDFVVCKVTGSVSDQLTYGQCTVSIHLFARDVRNIKNREKLSIMQRKVAEGLPLSLAGMIIRGNPRVVGDTSDNSGYHVRIINYRVTLKVTD